MAAKKNPQRQELVLKEGFGMLSCCCNIEVLLIERENTQAGSRRDTTQKTCQESICS